MKATHPPYRAMAAEFLRQLVVDDPDTTLPARLALYRLDDGRLFAIEARGLAGASHPVFHPYKRSVRVMLPEDLGEVVRGEAQPDRWIPRLLAKILALEPRTGRALAARHSHHLILQAGGGNADGEAAHAMVRMLCAYLDHLAPQGYAFGRFRDDPNAVGLFPAADSLPLA